MTLNATTLLLNQRHARRFAFVSFAAFAIALPAPLFAQVVKAPRYGQTPVSAPQPQLALPSLPTAITPHGTVVEDIVVRVNDQIISRSDVERQEESLLQAAQQNNASKDDIANEQKNMLRDMIDQQLLLSKAKELGLSADAEVVRRLDEIRKGNKMDSMEQLEAAARKEGINWEDFKAQIKNQILTQMVVRDEVGRRLQLSQADAVKYYNAHKDEFQQPEQIRLSEILIPTTDNPTDAELAQAEAKAKEVKAQLDAGANFGDLAKKYSGGPSAAQGGELGVFKRGALAKVLEDQTFALKPGQATAPTRTKQGFVILEVTEHQMAGPAPMKDVEPQIEDHLYMDAMQPALRAYLTKLRVDSYVEVAPGFVDSGASPDQTKPIMTAYAPPAPKKKVEKEKERFERNGAYSTAKAKPVVASPDTTGTRTLTGADAPKAAAVDSNTGLAVISAPTKPNGKPRHIHREKVRFGQAPRNTLGTGAAQNTTPDAAAPGTTPGAAAAPGAVIASNGTTPDAETANLEDNPLTPKAPEKVKTRFSDKSAEVKAKKANTLTAKKQEKVIAKPVAMTDEEKAAAKVQDAPLGLAGDTAKKPKKPKKQKGQPKERLQEKPADVKPAPATPDPTVNPALAPTSLPATNTPAPASTPAPANPPQL